MLAMPFNAPEGWTVDDLLVDADGQPLTNGSICIWHPETLRYETTSLLPPGGTGFWVFSNATGDTAPQHGEDYPAAKAVQISGWYLLGPLACSDAVFNIPDGTEACIWDPAQNTYVLVSTDNPPEPGQGCWMYIPVEDE
jgi:hypothetical protein